MIKPWGMAVSQGFSAVWVYGEISKHGVNWCSFWMDWCQNWCRKYECTHGKNCSLRKDYLMKKKFRVFLLMYEL